MAFLGWFQSFRLGLVSRVPAAYPRRTGWVRTGSVNKGQLFSERSKEVGSASFRELQGQLGIMRRSEPEVEGLTEGLVTMRHLALGSQPAVAPVGVVHAGLLHMKVGHPRLGLRLGVVLGRAVGRHRTLPVLEHHRRQRLLGSQLQAPPQFGLCRQSAADEARPDEPLILYRAAHDKIIDLQTKCNKNKFAFIHTSPAWFRHALQLLAWPSFCLDAIDHRPKELTHLPPIKYKAYISIYKSVFGLEARRGKRQVAQLIGVGVVLPVDVLGREGLEQVGEVDGQHVEVGYFGGRDFVLPLDALNGQLAVALDHQMPDAIEMAVDQAVQQGEVLGFVVGPLAHVDGPLQQDLLPCADPVAAPSRPRVGLAAPIEICIVLQ